MSVKSIFELEEFKKYERRWNSRTKELSRRASYYDGSVYKNMREGLDWLAPRLYRGIKPLYLPLSQAVDVDAGIVPGGWKLPEDEPKADLWQKAINTIFDWSKWDTDGVLYIHYGAQYGVSGLHVADLRTDNMIVVQPVDPLLFMLIDENLYTDNADMAIWIEKLPGEDGTDFEYAEVTTPDLIRTFKNGIPAGFDGRESEYKNELGFVPYVEVRHVETGKPLGECTYQKAIPLLDEVNEIASHLADIIKKNADAQWAIFGAEPSDIEHASDVVWFFPQGADAKPLVPGIDIDGVLAFVQEIAKNVKEALPEKAFDDLQKKDQVATATLELQLMELVLKIKRVRPNYDRGLTTALQMAGRAAKTMSLSDIAALDDPGLRFDPERDILPLDQKTQIELETAQLELDMLKNSTMITEGDNV